MSGGACFFLALDSQEKCCFRQLVVQGYVSHLVAFSCSHKPLSLVCGSIHHKPVLSCKVLSLLKIGCPLGFGAGLRGLGYLVLDLMHHAFLESMISRKVMLWLCFCGHKQALPFCTSPGLCLAGEVGARVSPCS